MVVNTFKTRISKLNPEFRFSVGHSQNLKKITEIKQNGNFVYLKNILLSPPQYGSGQAGKEVEDEDFLRYIRITDIDNYGNLRNDNPKTVEVFEEKYLLKHNDFLFARSGNTVGKSFLYQDELHPQAIFAGYFIRFEINFDIIHPKVFLWYTKSQIFETWKQSVIRVMGQPNINAEEYKNLPVPIIDKNLQQTLVAEIEKIELEIQELKKVLREPLEIINEVFAEFLDFDFEDFERLKNIKNSFLKLSDLKSPLQRIAIPFNRPTSFFLREFFAKNRYIKLKNILIEEIHRGTQPVYTENGVVVIKTGNIQKGRVLFEETEFVSEYFYEKNKEGSGLKENDLLLTSTGMGRGKFALYDSDDEAIADSHVSIIRFDKLLFVPLFLNYYCQSFFGIEQLRYLELQIKGTPEIYRTQLNEFRVPQTDLSTQAQIVNRIKSQLDKQTETEKQINSKRAEISKMIEKTIKL